MHTFVLSFKTAEENKLQKIQEVMKFLKDMYEIDFSSLYGETNDRGEVIISVTPRESGWTLDAVIETVLFYQKESSVRLLGAAFSV
jgi:NADPH-dependent 7-cyano-7-deazaguanine reductase QueF